MAETCFICSEDIKPDQATGQVENPPGTQVTVHQPCKENWDGMPPGGKVFALQFKYPYIRRVKSFLRCNTCGLPKGADPELYPKQCTCPEGGT